MSKSQSGFAALEAILVIIIVVAIGGVGYYIYQASNSATSTYNSANGDQTTVAPVKKTDSTARTVADLVNFGKATYGGYFGMLTTGHTRAQALAIVKTNFSADTYNKLVAHEKDSVDPLTCTSQKIDVKYQVTAIDASGKPLADTASPNGASLEFSASTEKGSAVLHLSTNPIKITDVSCPN